MTLECVAIDWETQQETSYSLIVDEAMLLQLASGYVPNVVKAMCEDVLHFRDQDEARARANAAVDRRTKRRRKAG